jgi:hypothetical protein
MLASPKPEPFSLSKGVFRWIDNHIPWLQRLGWSALLVVILSILSGAPDVQHFLHWQPMWWERAIDWKVHHPLSPIPVTEFAEPTPENWGRSVHLLKRTYRVTLPVIAYCLGLDIRGTEILAGLCSLAFSFVILLQFRKLLPADRVTALLLALAVACSFIGQWGTAVTYFFDGVGYLLEACALYSESPSLIALLTAAGGFSDERVIAAVPLIYLVQVRPPLANVRLRALFHPNALQYGTIAGVVLFLLLRVVLGLRIGHHFDTVDVGFASLRHNAMVLPLGLLLVYKGSTLVIAGGLARLASLRSGAALSLLLICSLPGIAASLLVWDLQRSLAYTFPALLFSARVLTESPGIPEIRIVALRGAILSACLPTYYFWLDTLHHLPIAGPLFWGG